MTRIKSAFYAKTGGRSADLWSILHPPYTIWNMSYAAIGASLAESINWMILFWTLLAFFLGTGIASHALDELKGRPLKTGFSDRELLSFSIAALAACFILALVASFILTPWIMAFAALGILLVVGYALEWAQGLVHTDLGFALSWGGFPVIVGYFAQEKSISAAALLAAAAAVFYSLAQRKLSTPARFVRRSTRNAKVLFESAEGNTEWDLTHLLSTWEDPLKKMCWSIFLLALGLLALHQLGE